MYQIFPCLPRRHLSRRNIGRIKLLLFIIGAFLFIILLTGNSIENDEEWYKHPNAYFKEVSCEIDEYTQNLNYELTLKLKKTLEQLKLNYFLCYGSLWGVLKFKSTLPWDRNVDVCIVYHELVNVNEQVFHQAFKNNELNYFYNTRRGKYVVFYKTVSAEITVFEKVGHHMERVGWEKRLFPHLYYSYQNFPSLLIEPEMDKLEFNKVLMPVPHQQYELQKYLYPENWWKEIKPKGCF